MSKFGFLQNKKILLIICLFIIGAVLILFGSGERKASTDDTIKSENEISYSEIIEDKLEDFLMTVDGIESVKVFVTVDGGKEYEYAKIGKNEDIASDYLIVDKGNEEEAAVVREVYPGIRGVGISCTGGNDPETRNSITNLISAALGISSNKIMVTGYR